MCITQLNIADQIVCTRTSRLLFAPESRIFAFHVDLGLVFQSFATHS